MTKMNLNDWGKHFQVFLNGTEIKPVNELEITFTADHEIKVILTYLEPLKSEWVEKTIFPFELDISDDKYRKSRLSMKAGSSYIIETDRQSAL